MEHVSRWLRRAGLLTTMLLLVSIAAAPVAAASPNPPPLQNDCGTGADAGGAHATASSISVPKVNCTGDLLIAVDTADWYQFFASYGSVISASMTPAAGSNFNLCLYPPTGASAVACSTNGAGVTDSLTYAATSGGQWRIAVSFVSQVGDRYTMSVSRTPTQNDCGTGDDAGGSLSGAAPITLPKEDCAAELVYPGDTEDWYRFPVTSGQTITTSMIGNESASYGLCLYSPTSTLVGSCAFDSGGGTAGFSHNATVSGIYRLQVTLLTGPGGYAMTVVLQDDCGIGNDAGNSHATAALIVVPEGCIGWLTPTADEQDWYQFAVTSGQTIEAILTNNASSDYDLCLYSPTGTFLSCTFGPVCGSSSITYTAPTTGNYRVLVRIFSGSGTYTMTVSK